MTVTGSTTAAKATVTYTPPFSYVSSQPAAVQVTGSVTSAISNNPTVSAGASDSDYAWAYLQAHMMSTPSYRYAYLLWMVFALLAVLYAASHHARLSGGFLGAAFTRFGIRRPTLGSKRPGARNRALHSNNVNLMLLLIAVVTIVLSLIGADYINPTSSILDFSTSFNNSYKRAVSTAPKYTIQKSFWTLGSRFGFMAFALIPLVVLFALKAPPVAFLSLHWFTDIHHDKLAALHRGVAWLVWIITTAHVVLWTIQLFEDQRNGKAAWLYLISTNYRFICGCVAYLFMTLLMVLSLRPVRKNKYEFFYISHVVLVILTLAASAIHHPVLWYWMAAAGGIWALERASRYLRMSHINGFFHKKPQYPIGGMRYSNVPTNEYGMQDLKQPYETSPRRVVDKTLPRAPSEPTLAQQDDFGAKPHDYYDEGSFQPLGAYENRYSDPYAASEPQSRTMTPSRSQQGLYDRPTTTHERNQSSLSAPFVTAAPEIPVGYAYAQLLPSRTVRLTIRPPKPFRWAAGQSALLYLPELSRIQSHPFTIVNNNDDEIVLLVKARKGLTRRLYNLVRSRSLASVGVHAVKDKRVSMQSFRTGGDGTQSVQVPPINIRAWVDGPFGSSTRVRWGDYSTVVIICGGSGVSFGAAICDHVCRMIAKNAQIMSSKFKTERVRFCWVVREYAEIAWVAGQLYRCQQMVTSVQLEISIFVTRAPTATHDFALPKPSFAAHNRTNSMDSIGSEMSTDSRLDLEEPLSQELDPSTQYADVLDLTNYNDEEDTNDPAEQQLSNRLQYQGKVRRAKSRKAAKKSQGGGYQRSGLYPPRRPGAKSSDGGHEMPQARRMPSSLGLDDGFGHETSSQGHYSQPSYSAHGHASSSQGHGSGMQRTSSYQDGLAPDNMSSHARSPFGSRLPSYNNLAIDAPLEPPRPLSNNEKRMSWRSIADSTYGMYDPAFAMGDRGPSPAPSMFFDDAQSIAGESVRGLLPPRASRTGSMVLLEDSGLDPTNDAAMWIDQADFAAMNVMSEMAVAGKPKLSTVLEEELDRTTGATIVATCGPVTLNTVVRNLVAKHISPARIRHGDRRGHIAIFSEDYES